MMALKVYVAGAWKEKAERAEKFIAALREGGVEITHDWTKSENTGKGDWDLSRAQRAQFAREDLRGVSDADILWLLVPSTDVSAGSWTEFGYAMGVRAFGEHPPAIVVSGPLVLRSIFTELADHKFETDGAALEFVLSLRR